MTPTEIKNIISKGETAKVDFKREWYKKEELKGELVKDIFALANGSVDTIDETAYLIIGITDNQREFFDFDTSSIKSLERLKKQILTNLNNYAQPEFLNLEIEWVEFGEEQDILVLSIAPHGRLISLSKDLQLKKGTDKKGTVYYRIGEEIRVASADVILDFQKAYNKNKMGNGITININGDVNGIGTVTGGSVTQTLNFNR